MAGPRPKFKRTSRITGSPASTKGLSWSGERSWPGTAPTRPRGPPGVGVLLQRRLQRSPRPGPALVPHGKLGRLPSLRGLGGGDRGKPGRLPQGFQRLAFGPAAEPEGPGAGGVRPVRGGPGRVPAQPGRGPGRPGPGGRPDRQGPARGAPGRDGGGCRGGGVFRPGVRPHPLPGHPGRHGRPGPGGDPGGGRGPHGRPHLPALRAAGAAPGARRAGHPGLRRPAGAPGRDGRAAIGLAGSQLHPGLPGHRPDLRPGEFQRRLPGAEGPGSGLLLPGDADAVPRLQRPRRGPGGARGPPLGPLGEGAVPGDGLDRLCRSLRRHGLRREPAGVRGGPAGLWSFLRPDGRRGESPAGGSVASGGAGHGFRRRSRAPSGWEPSRPAL